MQIFWAITIVVRTVTLDYTSLPPYGVFYGACGGIRDKGRPCYQPVFEALQHLVTITQPDVMMRVMGTAALLTLNDLWPWQEKPQSGSSLTALPRSDPAVVCLFECL